MKSSKLISVAALVLFAPTVMASNTWYVDGVSGSDSNTCISPTIACKTIGHAISLAASGDTIMVAGANYIGTLVIGISLHIVGCAPCTNATVIEGFGGPRDILPPMVNISNATAHVSLSNLTITGGFSGRGGGVYNQGVLTLNAVTIRGNIAYGFSPNGGGIANFGTLIINHSTISGNIARGNIGEMNTHAFGGGIANYGALTINNSTITENSAGGYYAGGGGIVSSGTLMINNSTFSGNSVAGQLIGRGGGIYNTGTLTISSSTLSGNSASATLSTLVAGGIFNLGTSTFQNTIVANSTHGGNCSGTVTSHGYNVSSDGTCNLSGPGDLNNHDPLLGPLQNNGGPTHTMALLSGSPAIDSGNPNGCTDGNGHLLTTDQRGMPRPDKEDIGRCDIGAYERQSD